MASILQVPISAFQDKFGWSKNKSVSIVGGVSAIISIAMFSTTNAITFVDVIDHFANNIGVVTGAILSIAWVTWLNRHLLPKLITHINNISSFKVGNIWTFMLTVVTPLSLIVALLLSLYSLVTEGYGGYPIGVQLVFGWGIVLLFVVAAFVLPKIKGHASHDNDEHKI